MLGLRHKEALMLLCVVNDIIISIHILIRTSNSGKNLSHPVTFLIDQLDRCQRCHGFKVPHLKCVQHEHVVTQGTIRHLLKFLDPPPPSGVEQKQMRLYVILDLISCEMSINLASLNPKQELEQT